VRKLIFKILILIIPVIILFVISVFVFANGYIDVYYLKFTTPQKPSLVIGMSKAVIDIQPSIINNSGLVFDKPMYNFGFNFGNSPYGKIYLDAIKKKVKPETHNGIFILEVSPLSISIQNSVKENYFENAPENGRFLNHQFFFNTNPNFEYLLRHYENSYYFMFLNNIKKEVLIHDDGWLEGFTKLSDSEIEKRKTKWLKKYIDFYFKPSKFCQWRLDYLEETISFLKQHGKVYLVRVPIDKRMLELENNYMPDFNDKMAVLSKKENAKYIDFTVNCDNYKTYDANHLMKESSEKLTRKLAEIIKEDRTRSKKDQNSEIRN
jgi:hypothetical protein